MSNEWQDISTAPRDGTSVELLLEDDSTVIASSQTGFLTSKEEDCSCWVADEDSSYPECWTDGACWESNAEEMRSLQPVSWRAHLPNPPKQEA